MFAGLMVPVSGDGQGRNTQHTFCVTVKSNCHGDKKDMDVSNKPELW